MAYGFLEQKDDNRAVRVFEHLATTGEVSVPVLVNLGYCYMNVGAFEKAREPLETALEREPDRARSVPKLDRREAERRWVTSSKSESNAGASNS